MSLQKMRNGVEWTTIILKYVNEDKISEQEKLFAIELLKNCETIASEEVAGGNEYDDMWRQLNKYWKYLSTLKKHNRSYDDVILKSELVNMVKDVLTQPEPL